MEKHLQSGWWTSFCDVHQRVSHACIGFLIGGLGGLFRGIGFSFGLFSAPYMCRPGPEKEPLVHSCVGKLDKWNSPTPLPLKVGGMWVPCWVEGAGQDLAI